MNELNNINEEVELILLRAVLCSLPFGSTGPLLALVDACWPFRQNTVYSIYDEEIEIRERREDDRFDLFRNSVDPSFCMGMQIVTNARGEWYAHLGCGSHWAQIYIEDGAGERHIYLSTDSMESHRCWNDFVPDDSRTSDEIARDRCFEVFHMAEALVELSNRSLG